MHDPRQRAWLEVNPSAVEANTKAIKQVLSKGCELMAVVKADGYGHGAETVARAALRGGASDLGVATLDEGIQLRQASIDAPILLLGNLSSPEELSACLDWRLMPTLSTLKQAMLCQDLAEGTGSKFKVHLKVDTGMTRLGCDMKEVFSIVNTIQRFSNLNLKGVYSHLSMADGERYGKSERITSEQKRRFESVLEMLPPMKKEFCVHIANSAGTLRDPSLHYDMVRVGLALYGHSPIKDLELDLSLKPALGVKARVAFIRDVPSGVGVSYGHTFVTQRSSRLAVVGIGYADGVSRALSGQISALVNGKFLPQVGSITMDQLMLDITDYPDLKVGTIVTMLGQDGDQLISPKQWSDVSGSIPWEVLCGFKNRLPRIVI
ncbi:alanine racemase [Prochlorococcus sp. MIT 1341]|uniref:alanine racemase n=1 Tax=Prochlorococcus sp. MIT 1341 TaxID=3096221 RepID=UPI002A7623A0|nr:alanine racemase [Prochlorococcus sp. MIT 1341]